MKISIGDYVDCYGDRWQARLVGEVVSVGPKNLKVRTYYNPGGLPEAVEQIHTVAKADVKDIARNPAPRHYCPSCSASVTSTDIAAGACTQCGGKL